MTLREYTTVDETRRDVLSGTRLALQVLKLFYRGAADSGDEQDGK